MFVIILPLFSQEDEVEIIKRPPLKYEASDLKDPFEDALPKPDKPVKPITGPVGPAAATLPAMEVQGLVWGGSMPQAIIDGQVLKVGDTIKNVEILEINKDGIKVLYNSKLYKLSPPSSAPGSTSNR